MNINQCLCVALDNMTRDDALTAIADLYGQVGWFKVGLEFIVRQEAKPLIEAIKRHGCKVFLDAKLNDIPNTVAAAVKSAGTLGVDMVNIHALSGSDAMTAAVGAADPAGMKVAAVTILTSLDDDSLSGLGLKVRQSVDKLAEMAVDAGVHAIICSPTDLVCDGISGLPVDVLRVVPGIRPTWAAPNDQKRIATPASAITFGADILVIGRPITSPPGGISPVDAAGRILNEIAEQRSRAVSSEN